MATKKIQSVEPQIADMANNWLKSYGLDYKLEQDSLNSEIDFALDEYFSKTGGKGGNRPDAKLLLQDDALNYYPILIEYKGYKDKLEKLDDNGQIANRNANGDPNLKNISSYAVNGAVHYANALLHYTSYTDIIAIGVTGYKTDAGELSHSIGVYYVSKNNYGIGQKVDDYSDLSFLKKEHFNDFINKVKSLSLSPEAIALLKEKREKQINESLINLNNDIYQNEKGLSESDRVYLVAATIISTIGVPGKVAPLEKSNLLSLDEEGNRDGDIVLRKIRAFLSEKNIPESKRELIIRTLQNTLTTENINKVENGETQLKRVFCKILDDLGIYYKIGLNTDFTGKLFNEMYSWLGFTQDKLNDVVLTPSYVATLLVKLARVNRNSYVWDFATGSAGLLVAAMNEMIADAKNNITSSEQLAMKIVEIKANQLLGLEILPSIYMLAVLNMILMGDGSSNIMNKDSLLEFNGCYGYGDSDRAFPADAFVLNPPYSADGKGMVFVEKALSMMQKGYAAIIIHSAAGAGKAKEINKRILQNNTLLASIKMPNDLFVGKSKVLTNVYVFRVGEAHQNDDIVKFIDFSIDGYTRSNRRKSSNNLRDTNHAKERYQEVVDLVRFGSSKRKLLGENDYYEGHIDINNGSDWNQSKPVGLEIEPNELRNSIVASLIWSVVDSIQNNSSSSDKGNQDKAISDALKSTEWKTYQMDKLFKIEKIKGLDSNLLIEGTDYDYVTRTSANQGVSAVSGYINDKFTPAGTWSLDCMNKNIFYRNNPWYAGQFIRRIIPLIEIPESAIPFFTVVLNHQKQTLDSVLVRDIDQTFNSLEVALPIKDGALDFDFMANIISGLKKDYIDLLLEHLKDITE